MRSAILAVAVLTLTSSCLFADGYLSTPTQLKKKIIHARAAGEVKELNFREGQVFLWDEFAASIRPTQNVRPEFGRAYADFAGAVSRVLVAEGQTVEKGEPLFECRFLEHVYTSCVVPSTVPVREGQLIEATYRGERFEAKVLSTHNDGGQTFVNALIYNSNEGRYWHLTQGQQVRLHF